MAGLFGGNLDIGNVALRPGNGQWGGGIVRQSIRQVGVNIAKIDAMRRNQGSGPDIKNGWTVPPYYYSS